MKDKELKITFSKTFDSEKIDYYLKAVIRKAILETLRSEHFAFDAEVSVTLCDNSYIRKLNKQYRGKDKPTDVLSFPMYECDEIEIMACDNCVLLGDIVISVERALEQAKELGNSFLREVAFLAVHSTLHLLGYDHERSEEDDELQCRKQREIIDSFEI